MFLDAFVLAFSHTQYYNFAVQQIPNTQIHTVNSSQTALPAMDYCLYDTCHNTVAVVSMLYQE
jgi:hypothetical protein